MNDDNKWWPHGGGGWEKHQQWERGWFPVQAFVLVVTSSPPHCRNAAKPLSSLSNTHSWVCNQEPHRLNWFPRLRKWLTLYLCVKLGKSSSSGETAAETSLNWEFNKAAPAALRQLGDGEWNRWGTVAPCQWASFVKQPNTWTHQLYFYQRLFNTRVWGFLGI